MEFRAIRAHYHNAGRLAAREKVEASSKSDPIIVRGPLRRQRQIALLPSGFPSTGALPVVVTISFGTDSTLNTVSASVGTT
jgi:hypothetical protein